MPGPTVAASGTVTSSGVFQTLYTTTASGFFQLTVDFTNQGIGTTLQIQILSKTLTGGTAVTVQDVSVADVPAVIAWASDPVSSGYSGTLFKVKKTAGSNINYDWRVDTW